MSNLDLTCLPSSVDIRVLGVCNLSCSFCFGPRHDVRATRLNEICDLLPAFREHGVSRLVITGGEPLLVPRLPVLLERARGCDLHLVLSTNGSLLSRRHAQVVPHLTWIALPLDGPSAAVHDALRPGRRSSFHDVRSALQLVREIYPGVRIKLGTVVQPGNVGLVSDIPDVVTDWGVSPDVWKIYQVSFSNYAADNRERLLLSDECFEREVADALAAAESAGWRTVVYRNSERDGQYLFVEPSGDAMVIADGAERLIGNFLDDLPDVLRRWHAYVNIGRLERNADATYYE
jgi:molybdenum cofactor biosynthesis enzyme MoaA